MVRGALAAILVFGASGALAADLDFGAPAPSLGASLGPRWQGFTFGAYLSGDGSGAQQVTQGWFAPYPFFSASAPTNFNVTAYGAGVGVQIGYDKQFGQVVSGIMADYGWLAGAKGTYDYAGTITWPGIGWANEPFSGTYSQQLQWLGTARWRLGYAPDPDWLVYADAGLAYGQTIVSSSLQLPNGYAFNGSRSGPAIGYAIGGGFQYSMGPNWSLGADGFFYDLGNRDNVAVANFVTTNPTTGATLPSPQLSSRGEFSGFQLRLTALYQYDGEATEPQVFPSTDPNTDVPLTFGMRGGYSTGKTQMTLYGGSSGGQVSRLTYSGADVFTVEPFFNLEVPNWGLFLTGFVGFGQQRGGNLQDEDFPPDTNPYSSTDSALADGQLAYGVVDLGYNALRSESYRLGAFVGGAFQNDDYNAFGCTQTATNPSICAGGEAASGIGPNTLAISDQYTWSAVRLGLSGAYSFPGGLTISGDAAWLPYIAVSETDYHWLRMPGDFYSSIPGAGSSSQGFQLSARVAYRLTPGFDIGAGIRYWQMMARGNQNFQYATTYGGQQPTTWTTERLQAFLETGYHF